MHQLLQGDCLEIMPTLLPQSVDAIVCDPPYGITSCAWDSVIPFAPMWENIKRLIKPRGAVVLFGSQPFTSALVMSNPKWFRYEWCWQKSVATNYLNAYKQPLRNHENICVFYDEQPTYIPQMRKGLPYIDSRKKNERCLSASNQPSIKTPIVNKGERFPVTVLPFEHGNNDSDHNTAKPVDLLAYLIQTYTNPGDTVLDFTMGSGSTGVACAETGRNFIGIELDADYFAIAQERIEAAYRKAQGLPRQGKAADFADMPLFAEAD